MAPPASFAKCLSFVLISFGNAFISPNHRVAYWKKTNPNNKQSSRKKIVVDVLTQTEQYFDEPHPSYPGRVSNITQWLDWSDRSLARISDDEKGGLYERINSMSQATTTTNSPAVRILSPQDIHHNDRFAVLSHGNQTDPVYSYVNRAGFKVFRWPEEQYYKLPSRYSAPEGSERSTRASVISETEMRDVTYISEAIRVRYPKDTVVLRDAILWNVYDDDGYRVGQTVLFDSSLCSYSDE